jgi:hypothetical protein
MLVSVTFSRIEKVKLDPHPELELQNDEADHKLELKQFQNNSNSRNDDKERWEV